MDYLKTLADLRNCSENVAPCERCSRIDDECCTDHLLQEAADVIEEMINRYEASKSEP